MQGGIKQKMKDVNLCSESATCKSSLKPTSVIWHRERSISCNSASGHDGVLQMRKGSPICFPPLHCTFTKCVQCPNTYQNPSDVSAARRREENQDFLSCVRACVYALERQRQRHIDIDNDNDNDNDKLNVIISRTICLAPGWPYPF
jgi:hypothetical protein